THGSACAARAYLAGRLRPSYFHGQAGAQWAVAASARTRGFLIAPRDRTGRTLTAAALYRPLRPTLGARSDHRSERGGATCTTDAAQAIAARRRLPGSARSVLPPGIHHKPGRTDHDD